MGRGSVLSDAPVSGMAKRHTEITIQFKRAPFAIFQQTPVRKLHTNQLVIQIQPDGGNIAQLWGQDSRAASCEWDRWT